MKTRLVLLTFLAVAILPLSACNLPGDPFGMYPTYTPTSSTPSPTDTPTATSIPESTLTTTATVGISENLCDNPYWPIKEGATWIYEDGDTGMQNTVTIINVTSTYNETTFTFIDLHHPNGRIFHCTMDGIFDDTGHFWLPFNVQFQAGTTYEADGKKVKMQRFQQVTVPAGNFDIVRLCWEDFYVWCFDYAEGIGPVQANFSAMDVMGRLISYYFPSDVTLPEYTPTSEIQTANANIQGMIAYPSEGWCPEMNLYALNTTDNKQYSMNWNNYQCEFSFTVPAPGQYFLYAWPSDEYSNLGFMYSDDYVNPKPLNINIGENLSNIWLTFCPNGNVPKPLAQSEPQIQIDTNPLVGSVGEIAYSAIYGDKHTIFTMDSDGSSQKMINPNIVGNHPSWSPDSTKILSDYAGNDVANGGVYLMNSDGSNLQYLTPNDNLACCPEWSPDGSKIIFSSRRWGTPIPSGAFPDLYVMNADGSNVIKLTNIGADGGDWSPDGKRIAFWSNHYGITDIFIMNYDGSNQVQITTDGTNWFPRWSPDGKKIAFLSFRKGHNYVYEMNTDGSDQTILCSSLEDVYYLNWSPDGSKIILERGNGYFLQQIYIMNSDGTNPSFLTEGVAPDWRK